MQKKIKANYTSLASFYGTLMKSVDYVSWASYIKQIISSYHLHHSTLLEVGGGNGKLASASRIKYKRYILTEYSQPFLASSTFQGEKVCCDMKELPFKAKFDLIIAAFDTVNYLRSQKEFSNFLHEAFSALQPHGALLFDVSLERNSMSHTLPKIKTYKHLNKSVEHVSEYLVKLKTHVNTFTFSENGNMISKEVHKQKIFAFDTILKLIDKNNFYIADCLEAFGFKKGSLNSKRVQFILKKDVRHA